MRERAKQLAILEAMLQAIMEKQAAKDIGFAQASTLMLLKEVVQKTAEKLSQLEGDEE